MLFQAGDHAAAASLLADTLALVPGWAAGWFRLGEMREAAGELAAAAEAWTEALRLDPADRLGASLKLGLIGAAHAIEAPPSAFVETLFDQYAESFDRALVERLAYRVPDLIAAALEAAGARAFAHVVDLGCGTGLMGERLRRAASFLDGYDLSSGMLKKAQAKRLYDRLSQQDLQTFDPAGLKADLVVAADVFLYLGALERIVAACAAILPEGGLLAFSVERHAGPEPMQLRPSRRYAHSEAYLRDLLAKAGLAIVSMEAHPIRMDRGEPIVGLIVVARRGRANALAGAYAVGATEEIASADGMSEQLN
jgi:predicted TPR repeat methyltransferase